MYSPVPKPDLNFNPNLNFHAVSAIQIELLAPETQSINNWNDSQAALQRAEQFSSTKNVEKCNQILEKVVAYLKQESQQGNAEASFQLAKISIMKIKFFSYPEVVFNYFKAAGNKAESEDSEIPITGFGSLHNFEQAYTYFKRASDQGHQEAPWILSQLCLMNVKQFIEPLDDPLRHPWTGVSLNQGHFELKTALHWLTLAIKNGNELAIQELEKRDPKALEEIAKNDAKVAARLQEIKNRPADCVLL